MGYYLGCLPRHMTMTQSYELSSSCSKENEPLSLKILSLDWGGRFRATVEISSPRHLNLNQNNSRSSVKSSRAILKKNASVIK
ncbi:hypothetical protein TNCV_1961611 [Trichonephila clavipes]|nr:hypothetical protein TNCV_1961611 [Trichonephila clavipes]